MKLQLTALAAALLLAACGSDSSSNNSAPTYNVSGTLASQASPSGATICSDLNQNFACDASEPTTTTDSAGNFTLTSEQLAVLERPLLASMPTGSTIFVAPGQNKAEGNIINGVTSLLAGVVASGETVANADSMIKAELSKAGVELDGTLLESLQDNKLGMLEQNLSSLLNVTNNGNRLRVLSFLLHNLNYAGKSLITSDQLTTAELTDLSTELNSLATSSKALNDTGVSLYFSDANDSADVAEAPTDFPGQDAAYGFDSTDKQTTSGKGFKFVKLDAAGNELADDAAEWSCVLDQRSGLIWENKLDDDTSVRNKDRLFAIELTGFKPHPEDLALASCVDAEDGICSTQQYIDHINPQSLCGVSNWRLPSLYEFYDILDLGETAKDANDNVYGLTVRYFPNQGQGSNYTEYGEIWLDAFSFNTYSAFNYDGALQFPFVNALGEDRGEVSFAEIFSDQTTEDYDSYLFPVRLVATQVNN